MIVVGRTAQECVVMWQFLHDHGVEVPVSNDMQFIGRVEHDNLIAVVAYNGFNGRTCAMHVAGDGHWMSRELLHVAFAYPFCQLDMTFIFGMLAADNARAIKLDKHLGFEVQHRICHGWDRDTDLIVMGMHKSQCRWLTPPKGMHHGFKIKSAPSTKLRGGGERAECGLERNRHSAELGESS